MSPARTSPSMIAADLRSSMPTSSMLTTVCAACSTRPRRSRWTSSNSALTGGASSGSRWSSAPKSRYCCASPANTRRIATGSGLAPSASSDALGQVRLADAGGTAQYDRPWWAAREPCQNVGDQRVSAHRALPRVRIVPVVGSHPRAILARREPPEFSGRRGDRTTASPRPTPTSPRAVRRLRRESGTRDPGRRLRRSSRHWVHERPQRSH